MGTGEGGREVSGRAWKVLGGQLGVRGAVSSSREDCWGIGLGTWGRGP